MKEGLAQVDWLHCGDNLLCLSVCRGDWDMVEVLTSAKAQERHIWRGEGRGGVGLVMAETGNRREDMRFSGEAYLERRGGEGQGRRQ